MRQVTVSVRLDAAEYARLKVKAQALTPPAKPATIVRWLVAEWVKGGKRNGG